MPRAIMLAFTEPTEPSQDDVFNSWYDDKHLDDVVNVPGVVSAVRYKLAPSVELLASGPKIQQRFLAIYELEGDSEADLAKFADELRTALTDGRADIHTTMNMDTLGVAFALPITDVVMSPNA